MPPAPSCPKLDLGGRTVDSPCDVNWLGCSVEDFRMVRDLLVAEHNALVRSLDAFNRLVAKGRTKWTAVPSAAWKVYEESWALLQQYPKDYGQSWFDSNIYALRAPVTAFIRQAQTVHSAACDTDNAIRSLGEQVPSAPSEPDKDKTIGEQAVDFAHDIGRGITKIVVIGVAGVLAYTWISRK